MIDPRFTIVRFLLVLGATSLATPSYGQIGDQLGVPNPLTGRAGVAGPSSADSVNINPAHVANLSTSEAFVGWGLHRTNYQQRYPGFPTHASSDFGLNGAPSPGVYYKASPRLGVGGLLIPFPINQDVVLRDIPIIIFGQENQVDITGQGALKALINFNAGLGLGALSIGANFQYAALGASLSVNAGGGREPLANIQADIQSISLRLGVRYALNRSLTLGLATTAFGSTTTKLGIDTPLDGALGGDNANPNAPQASSTFLNPIRFGIGARVVPAVLVMFDIEYKRAVARNEFSLVDLVEKPKDVYATTSLFFGAMIRTRSDDEALLGFSYRPSEVGQGQRGAAGKAGFGFMDIVTGLGAPPSAPAWDISAGYRRHFGKPVGGRRSRIRTMSVEGGAIYGETSIGIDAQGEQPGAYLVRRIQIPVSFTYRF